MIRSLVTAGVAAATLSACASPVSAPSESPQVLRTDMFTSPAQPVVDEESIAPLSTAAAYSWSSACELLAGVDIEAVMGEPVGEPSMNTAAACQFEAADQESVASLNLFITSPGGADNFAFQRELMGVDQAFENLGDAAFLSGNMLRFLVDDAEFNLALVRPLDGEELTAQQRADVAAQVLANIGWE